MDVSGTSGVAVLAALLLAVACGDGSSSSNKGAAPAPAPTHTPAPPAGSGDATSCPTASPAAANLRLAGAVGSRPDCPLCAAAELALATSALVVGDEPGGEPGDEQVAEDDGRVLDDQSAADDGQVLDGRDGAAALADTAPACPPTAPAPAPAAAPAPDPAAAPPPAATVTKLCADVSATDLAVGALETFATADASASTACGGGGCHSGAAPHGFVDHEETWSDPDYARGMLTNIQTGAMPQGGRTLTPADRTAIISYICARLDL